MAIGDLFSNLTLGDFNVIFLKVLISLLIIIVGVFLGRILNFGLKKLSQKTNLSQHIKGGFVDLFLVVIRWSIYIIFINLALTQLEIPALTSFFSSILITIPTLVGALLLLVIGFSIAHYLKEIILNSEMKTSEVFSQIIFYFVIYMFGIYSLKTASISFDNSLTNNILLIFTLVYSMTVGYKVIKKN